MCCHWSLTYLLLFISLALSRPVELYSQINCFVVSYYFFFFFFLYPLCYSARTSRHLQRVRHSVGPFLFFRFSSAFSFFLSEGIVTLTVGDLVGNIKVSFVGFVLFLFMWGRVFYSFF